MNDYEEESGGLLSMFMRVLRNKREQAAAARAQASASNADTQPLNYISRDGKWKCPHCPRSIDFDLFEAHLALHRVLDDFVDTLDFDEEDTQPGKPVS